MATTDVAAFVGPYPYRHLGAVAAPGWLLNQMDRLHIERAWVGYLPALLHQDPAPGNEELHRLIRPHRDRLLPIPTVNPEQAGWEEDLNDAMSAGAGAIRLYPQHQGIDAAGSEMRVAVAAAAAAGLAVVLTVRFEDPRQRHPLDTAPDLPAAAVRTLVRSDPDLRLLVTHAGRRLIEEVHFGLTVTEAERLLWDISWVWGPPEDDLALLLETVGPARFALGTGMPLRIPDGAMAKLDLLSVTEEVRAGLLGAHVARWLSALR